MSVLRAVVRALSPGALGTALAWRYCRRRSIAWLALVGAVLAVTIRFVPEPVMDGFLRLMRENLRATSADVSVDLLGLPDDPAVRAEVARKLAAVPGVLAVAPRADGLVGITTLDRRQAIAGAQLAGIDVEAEARVTPYRDFLLELWTDTQAPFALSDRVRAFDLKWRRAAHDLAAAALGERFAATVDADAKALIEADDWYGPGGWGIAPPEDQASARQQAWMQRGEIALAALPYIRRLDVVKAADPDAPGACWDRAAAVAALETAWREAAQAHRTAAGGADLLPGIVVGEELMRRWPRLRPGAVVDCYTANLAQPRSLDGEAEVRPTSRPFVVTGVFSTGFHEWDERWCYADYETARAFFAGSRIAESWVLRAESAEAAPALARDVRPVAQGCVAVPPGAGSAADEIRRRYAEVRPWQDVKRTFLKAVESQKVMLLGLVSMGIVVAGIGVMVTLWVLVSEKTRDIGILAAMGAGPWTLVRVFVGTGVLLGFLGGVLGVAVASLVLANADAIVRFAAAVGFDALDSYVHDVQHLKRIPVAWDFWPAVTSVLWMCVSAFVFSLVPALRAALMDPVRAIRRG